MLNKNRIWTSIEDNLFPKVDPLKVVTKIFSLHLAVTFAVLLVCPQFGFSFFHFIDLSKYFMKVSHEFCQIACGATLFLSSSLVIYHQLKMTEREWLWKQKFLVYSLLIVLTGSFFVATAPDITVLNVALWAAGSTAGLFAKNILSLFKDETLV